MADLTGDWRPETLAAIDAVERALTLVQGGAGAAEITAKGERDLVTAADIAVEDVVRGMVIRTLGFPVVGEERGGRATADGSPYWLVDPICGTRNFASRIPLYCVNLALVERGEVTVAVVADPSRGEIVAAERGRGVWSLAEDGRHRLTTSAESRTLVVEDGKAKGRRREQAARFMTAVVQADRWDFRSLGSTLASSYLAAGRIAAYVVFWVSAVHAAAGSLLVTEAGGLVSDLDGRPWTIDSDSFVASAERHLHDELLGLARAASSA